MPSATKLVKKEAYDAKLCEFMDTYDRAFLVHADNVGSKQFMDIRAAIRDHSKILMGKNTMMRRCIRLYCERTGNDQWLQLLDHMVRLCREAGGVLLSRCSAGAVQPLESGAAAGVPGEQRQRGWRGCRSRPCGTTTAARGRDQPAEEQQQQDGACGQPRQADQTALLPRAPQHTLPTFRPQRHSDPAAGRAAPGTSTCSRPCCAC